MTRRVRPLADALKLLALATAGITTVPVSAQALHDLQRGPTPLTLASMGSFFVGGDRVAETGGEISTTSGADAIGGGHVTVNQMYVQFMVPAAATGLPVIMLHGATLSGKTFETTPDGRMGWYEYFVRHGHPVYVPDQVSRARSGFDVAAYNDVRAGKRPAATLPPAWRQSEEINWKVFRIGPVSGTPFADTQFPVQAVSQLSAQAVPDLNAVLPTPNPTFKAVTDLAEQLDGAVLVGHSQSGPFSLSATLAHARGIKGLVLVEPGYCEGKPFDDAELETLSSVPMLLVFGDHLDADTGIPGVSWRKIYEGCERFVERVNKHHGKATMLYLPAAGIHGNTHMMMQDRNNLRIADLILDWMDRAVGGRKTNP